MLEHSREFIVLANCLNYTKAASKLNVSQPSLSRHIADLEKELGFQLLERNPLVLTSAGRYYLESVNSIIKQLDDTIAQGRKIAERDNQDFSIYMLPANSLYSSIVYEGIARVRAEVDNFSPRICYADRTHSVFDAVIFGKAEVGVLLGEPSAIPQGYVCEWLVDSPVMVWLHENNPLLEKATLSFEDLADCSIVRSTTQSAHTWYDGMVSLFRKNGIEPKFHLKDLENRESFFLTLKQDEVLLASDEGETTCQCNSRLVGVRLKDPELFFSAHLLYRSEPSSPLVAKLVATCHSIAKEHCLAD